MKYDFAISYETITREYASITLLKKELERRGYSVLVYQATALTPRIKAEVVVKHSFYNDDDFKFIYYVFGKNQKILNLRWEEIFPKGSTETAKYLPKESAVKISHLAWGAREKEDLIQAGVEEKKIALTGAINLDFIRKPVFESKDRIALKYGLDGTKKWILFISSLNSQGGHRFKKTDKLYNPVVEAFVELSGETRKEMLVWFEKALKQYDDIELIYRPHPEELRQEIEDSFSDDVADRFHIISELDIAQWIYISDKVYNWNSTSGIQSYMLGKGLDFLCPIEIPDFLQYEMYDSCKKIKDVNDFLNDIISENKNERNDVLESFYLTDNGFAYEKVADYLEYLYNQPKDFDGINYDEVLSFRPKIEIIRNRFFRNFFVFMSKASMKSNLLKPLHRIFRLDYRPMERRNIITDEKIKYYEDYVEKFLAAQVKNDG